MYECRFDVTKWRVDNLCVSFSPGLEDDRLFEQLELTLLELHF